MPPNAFEGFLILRLVLNRNTLSQISDEAFNGALLDSIVELDLTDNNLGGVPQTGIKNLRNLRKLYLNRNKINGLEQNSFSQLESKDILLKLELAGNRLTDSSLGDGSVFRPLKSLQELSLETNALTQIPSAALVNQQKTLTNLNLGLNQVRLHCNTKHCLADTFYAVSRVILFNLSEYKSENGANPLMGLRDTVSALT